MISIALSSFEKSIEHITNFISNSEEIENIIIKSVRIEHNDAGFYKSILDHQRVYDDLIYEAKIVSIYGCLERYIEDAIEEYCHCLEKYLSHFNNCNISNYANSLFSIGGKLSSHPKLSSLTEETVIASLENCIINNHVIIIPDAFFSMSGNYTSKTINECFHRLGIESFMKKVCKIDPIASQLRKAFGGNSFEQKNIEVLFSSIDDLVQRRNEIAHGKPVLERLSNDLILDKTAFLKNTIQSINSTLNNHLLSLIWEENNVYYTPVKVYQHRILGFQSPVRCSITKGDFVILQHRISSAQFEYSIARIEEIRDDKCQVSQSIDPSSELNSFSIRVDTYVHSSVQVLFFQPSN